MTSGRDAFYDDLAEKPQHRYRCRCAICSEMFDSDNKRAVACPSCRTAAKPPSKARLEEITIMYAYTRSRAACPYEYAIRDLLAALGRFE